MSKVKDFNSYIDLQFGPKSNGSHLKEGLMNSLTNAIASYIPFSKINTIGHIKDNILEFEKDLLKAKYDLKKTLRNMDLKLKGIRDRTPINQDAVDSIKEQIEAKKNEYKAMVKSKSMAIERAKELLKKEASKSPRLKEAIKAKMAELEIELSEYEYDLAKKISAEASEIENLKDALDQAKKEAQEMINKLTTP